jgi:hypothetical protein
MEYEITWGGEVEDVHVTTAGLASQEGLTAYTREVLNDSRWRPGMRLLTDHRELDWSALSPSDLRERVDTVLRERERLGPARLAVVVGRKLEYGFQRMMMAYSEEQRGDTEIGVFYTVEDARAWLGRFPGPDAT